MASVFELAVGLRRAGALPAPSCTVKAGRERTRIPAHWQYDSAILIPSQLRTAGESNMIPPAA